MNKHTLTAAAALAFASMLSLPAYSQDHDRRHDEGHGRMHEDHGRRMDRERHEAMERHEDRGEWERRDWHRGDRLPPAYRDRQYVVEDWRGHRLNRPPRGYQWVQVPGGDYALVSIGNGVIANIVIGR